MEIPQDPVDQRLAGKPFKEQLCVVVVVMMTMMMWVATNTHTISSSPLYRLTNESNFVIVQWHATAVHVEAD
jgi:hypothetical protein